MVKDEKIESRTNANLEYSIFKIDLLQNSFCGMIESFRRVLDLMYFGCSLRSLIQT
jgi:hypothetical protein